MKLKSFFRRPCCSQIPRRSAFMPTALAAIFFCVTNPAFGAETNSVNEKIQALGIRDDTLQSDQQPFNWLWERREQLVTPLVAGLQSTNLETARQCLRILDGVKPTPALENALLKIAGDSKHPLRASAILSLCWFSGDPRPMNMLKSIWSNAVVFPYAGDRATLAEATGHQKEAAELLGSVLATNIFESECQKIIQLLSTNGTPTALKILGQATTDKRWLVARAALLALAKTDPAGHKLTAAQQEFLETTGFRFKESNDAHLKRYQKLAALPREEIRPLLHHMLTTDQGGDAASIYGLCHDTEALPEIRHRALTNENWQAKPFIAAWLVLDQSDQPINELTDKIRTAKNELQQEYTLRTVAESDLPLARKLAFFRAVRDNAKINKVVASIFLGFNQPILMATLFDEETNLDAIGQYAACIGPSPNPVYEIALRRAVEILASVPPNILQDQNRSYGFYLVMKAAAVQHVRGLDDSALRLMNQPELHVAIAAARLAASGTNRETAVALLYREMGNPEKFARQITAESLLQIPCVNDEERRQREQVVLALLGQPAEDYALRVLTTCAGPRTITQLEPLLDGTNLPTARYAAWVLAQNTNSVVARKALRRLALHALFCFTMAQQSAGISFEIAPGLSFGQTIEPVNQRTNTNTTQPGLQIPADLMLPTQLDVAEQTFLVRDYRDVLTFPYFTSTDATFLPLFEVVAREDSRLERLYVQGRKVAHFPNRQAAARNIARITGKPATYLGLTGEALAADQVPSQPYSDQDQLVARFLLDRIQGANLNERPATDQDWSHVGYFNNLIQHLTSDQPYDSGFGGGLKDAILLEAGKRQLGPVLKNAGFSLWR